jgi:cation transport ATPase
MTAASAGDKVDLNCSGLNTTRAARASIRTSEESRLASKKRESRFWDVLALLASSLLVVIVGVGSFMVGDAYHVSSNWILSVWLTLFFWIMIGWNYRGEFKSVYFLVFFFAWSVVHSLIVLAFFTWHVSWLYYVPAVALELSTIYVSAYLLLGLQPRR